MRRLLRLAMLLGPLAACAIPPPDAYEAPQGSAKPAAQVAIGVNAVGETCTEQPLGGRSADIYCGNWQQPSGRVRPAGAPSEADLGALATGGPWRAGIDARFICGPPAPTTILGGDPAVLMQCTRRSGGWPQVAMVASAGGEAWLADGVLPAAPVLERAIGVLSGQLRADAAPPISGTAALLADRLAARSFGSNDIGTWFDLMAQGSLANQAGNPASAEHAYRAALAIQQKAFGKNDPRTAETLARLALQLSNQGRFAEADALFAEADRLAPRSDGSIGPALLLHYKALNALYQDKTDEALPLLAQAEAQYAALLPPEVLRARPAPVSTISPFAATSNARLAPLLGNADLVTDPTEQRALRGLIEVRRYRAVALRSLGRIDESDAALRSALDLQRATGQARGIEYARLARNSALTASSRGALSQALNELAASEAVFGVALPGSRALAETYLLQAGELSRAGRAPAALTICRSAVQGLILLRTGVRPELLAPCLDVYAAEAGRHAGNAQAALAEMFVASQLVQGSITTQQISRATVRLQENARDPKVGEAIRRYDDAGERLAALNRQRDNLAQDQRPGGAAAPAADTADLDKRIADAQAALADAEAAVQAASPNYGQLVQQVVPAKEVFASLHAGEAFAAITLADTGGWVFLLRNGTITVAKVSGDAKRIGALVQRIRAGVEPTESGLPRFDTAAAQQLYAATLAGVAPGMAGVQSLTIAPTGPLLAIPFELLLTGNADPADLANAPWLMRKVAIAHVPAAANFVSLRKTSGGSRAALPWFGFGEFHPVTLAQAERSFPDSRCADSAKLLAGLPPLASAAKELEAARLLLGARASDQLLGAAFTVDAVRKAPLQNYRVLHFATHAVLPTDLVCQRDPAIITSPPPRSADASGAMLTSTDILRLKLDADVVILSACNSGGLGGSVAGESLSDLARSFFFAGARSMMVTHWSVSDQTGAYLVADTLRRLRATPAGGVAGALRDSQLALLADAGHGLPAEIAHPFFWAPFAVIGNGGESLGQAQAWLGSGGAWAATTGEQPRPSESR